MKKENEIKIFEDKRVRTLWDAEQEKWYLSIVDVVAVLTDSPNPRKYWSVLKTRLKAEGSQLATNCSQLKMQSADGKFYLTDVADTEQLFRLIQSIPSPKAEPFKLWLAQVAAERLDEMQDPELSIDRALEQYMKLGYSENWINQRLKSIEIRKELTDEWKKRGLQEGVQFATLTDIITKAWADKTTKEYKVLKGLKKENLRDNMTNTELILNMLAEASTKDISEAVQPKDFEESKKVAKQGGNVAKVALKELEAKTGKKVVTSLNAKSALGLPDKTKKKEMMAFNEQNTVEHFIIHQLTGVNLNAVRGNVVKEDAAEYDTVKWKYTQADLLQRDITEVFVEKELKEALCRLNPEIAANPDRADEVIHKLRAMLITVNNVGLVRANEEFAKWLRNEVTLPIGNNNEHVAIRLIDFEVLKNNSFVLCNQFKLRARETKIPDIVLFVNGIPLVVGEAKTPVRPAVTWFDAAHDINVVYENAIPQLFVPNVFSFATEGKEIFIGGVRTPLEFWAPWRLEDEKDELSHFIGLQDVANQLTHLLRPSTLLDILQYYTVYATNSKKKKIKVVCRYQQYEGANAIVERVREGKIKKGLIWHFQGSGKSLLMLFAAQKLRKQQDLHNPTVMIVVDRVDLDTQITATFNTAEVPNMITTDSIKELHKLLEQDTRKIIITMVHKFKDAYPDMNKRDNIIVMVDEAHRTQEGDLGRKMRNALPNAFLFGLTGTPINKADKNTFWAFGAEQDSGGYMSRYTFQESIRDNATLPLHFEPRLPNYHIDKESLDIAFKEMANDLSEEDRNKLSQKAANMAVFLKSPERVKTIVADIVEHFKAHVDPEGLKAMIVTPDREACVQYKEALDLLINSEASEVVISSSANDDFDFKQKYAMDKDKQEKVVEKYNDADSPLKFLIVTAKLLTGFDAPILQTMYLDKSLKDHTLLQAICRTNRLFPNKTFGRIVDYFGVFDDTAKALAFDEESVKRVITNLQELKDQLPEWMSTCLGHFAGVDRSISGFEGLSKAQDCINTNEKRDAFAKDFSSLTKLWEALSPDPVINPFEKDYKWLSQVYTSVKPASDDNGRLLWHALGAQTTALIHEHIHVSGINHDMEEMILDAEVIDDLMHKKDPKQAERVLKLLISRLNKHGNNSTFKQLSERLEAIRDKAEKGLINSIEFIKELCQLAKETLQAEKGTEPEVEQKNAKAALTELFLELKTDTTPAIVERIVNDIDEIVRVVRFDGWQNSTVGEREVKRELRKVLWTKYQIKDEDLFNRAYEYIKEYY